MLNPPTILFFKIAERFPVATVPCDFAAGIPVADGVLLLLFRCLCNFALHFYVYNTRSADESGVGYCFKPYF